MTGPWLIPGNVALECSLCYRLMMLVCTQKQHGVFGAGRLSQLASMFSKLYYV